MSPDFASSAPRMMLPPPTTTAIWVPASVADLTSFAMELSSSVEIPKPPGEQKASPESLRRTRLGLGRNDLDDLDMFAPGPLVRQG